MLPKPIQDLLARHEALKTERSNWLDHWQDLAEIFLPNRADITSERSPGERRMERVFDSVPMLARRGLSSTIGGLLMPRTKPWVVVSTGDDKLDEVSEVRAWLEIVNERLWRSIYNPLSNFTERSNEIDDDLVTFGTGCLLILQGRGRLNFRALHIKRVTFATDQDGQIDTIFVEMDRTVSQLIKEYGIDSLDGRTAEMAREGGKSLDKKVKLVWAVVPREDARIGSPFATDMPWAEYVIDKDSEHVIKEWGFAEFPAAIPRWDTRSEERYGRSPAMLALPDANTLQQMGKTNLIAGQKAASPPLLVNSDSVFGTPRMFPDGITYWSKFQSGDRSTRPVEPLFTGANIPLTREMQGDFREQIFAAFFRNVFNLPVDSPRMTATEILERKDEFLRTVGPVFGRLQDSYPAVIARRSFRILLRVGAFPPPPEILRARRIRFELISPTEQARKQIEAAGFSRGLELLAPIGTAQPEVYDNFDGDEIARDIPELFGAPKRWLRPVNDVAAIRQQRVQKQEAIERLQAGLAVADISETAAGAAS